MCLCLHDYQSKASRYRKGLTYLKSKITTNPEQAINSPKPKRRKHKHKSKPSNLKKKNEKNTESTRKRGLKWQ